MISREYSVEEILVALYNGLCIEINARHSDTTLDVHLKKFNFFRISNNVFVFSDNRHESISTEFFEGMLIDENKKRLNINKNTKFYKYIFPFLRFRANEYGCVKTDWYDINLLVSKLPTRESIINNLLLEL